MNRFAATCGVLGLAALAFACGGTGPAEDVGSTSDPLSSGEYVSTASGIGDATYIGDWEHDWGYVLGYLGAGAKIYANTVTQDSVYGLIEGTGYGGWDHGQKCGWVSLQGVSGSGTHASEADVCPPPDNDFSLASGQPSGLFKPGTVVVSNGVVQPAVVLPTCPDLTVYANYDPASHTFQDPDGAESPGRGTMPTASDKSCSRYGVPQQGVTSGYCGFGTRFITADGVAVEIKDTQRGSGVTAFGFMHAECIAGSQVGNPSPPPVSCGGLKPGQRLDPGQSTSSCDGQYTFVVQGSDGNLVEYQGATPLWASNTEGHAGDFLAMQTDGNLVLYAGSTALWNSGTYGHPGAYLAVQDDGNLVVYDGSTPLWARFGLPSSGPTPPPKSTPAPTPAPSLHCCALCRNRKDAYEAGGSSSCKQDSIDFCSINDRGGVNLWYEGDCGAAP